MSDEKKGLNLTKIASAVQTGDFNWSPGATSVSRLSVEEQDLRLGLELVEEDLVRVEAEFTREAPTLEYAKSRDWRDWVTDIRDQGNCGSCVAFGTIAAIECQARIQYNKPSLDINLSEADLFFCGAGRKCSHGWWPSYALDYAKSKGISDEKCFPYQDHDMDCNICDDKSDRMLKIDEWQEIVKVDQRKAWLDKRGPMVACMAVYRDFFYYKNGVYSHATGDLAGYHAICCIGYNDDEEYWICKNSWGADWGEYGFFKIAYGQADIDTKFAMYGIGKISGTLIVDGDEGCAWTKHIVVDYSFTGNRCVLWAYLDGKWRHKIVTDAQLAGLGDTLFDASAVEACYEGDKITQIRGWKNFS